MEQASNKNIYLIHGGEPLQTLEAITKIRENLKKQGFTERKTFTVNNSFKWNELLETNQNLSLFSEKQLLELYINDGKIGLHGAKSILQFIDNNFEAIRLIIIADKLDNSIQNTKWFTAIQKAGYIIAAKPINEEQFSKWIITRFKNAGFTINTGMVALLVNLYHGNLVSISQLIEIISLAIPKGELTLEQITPYLHNNSAFNVFNLIDAALNQNSNKVCQIFNRLQYNKTEPIIILWALAREIRTLIKVSFSLEKKVPFNEICKENGIWPSKANKIRKYLNSTSRDNLENILQKLTDIDCAIKGIKPGSIWEPLLGVYLEFSCIKS